MMSKTKLCLIVFTLIAVGALVNMQFNDDENTSPGEVFSSFKETTIEASDPRKQEQFAYTFTLERQGKVNTDLFDPEYKTPENIEAGGLAVKSSLSGTLNIKFIGIKGESRLYFASFGELKGENSLRGENTEESSSPFAFNLHQNGSISLYETDLSYDDEPVSLALQLLPYLQVVGLNSAGDAWQTREIDLIGRYNSDYTARRSDRMITVEKRKRTYDKVNALPSLFQKRYANAQATVSSHEALVNLTPGSLWADKVTVSERIVMESGGTIVSDIPTTFSAHYAEFDSRIVLPESLAELASMLADGATKGDDYAVDDKLYALVAGKNIDEVFSYYYSAAEGDAFFAQKVLINYLRANPVLSTAFVDKIYAERSQLTDSAEVKLWYLLAKTGHKEAQDAYIYALENTAFDQIMQYRAIGHVRVFERPTAEFVDALWNIQNRLDEQAAEGNFDNQVLAKGALFAIATLSASEKIDGAVKESILINLKEKLDRAPDDTARAGLVTAIGNTNDGSLMTSITPHLDSANEKLKGEAFKAMARMPGKEAVDIYLNAYEHIDPSNHNMQFQALNNLQKMSLTKESMTWASNRALQLNNKTETKHLIQILGDNMSEFSAAEVTLRTLLTKDLSPQLKSDIYKYIAPKR